MKIKMTTPLVEMDGDEMTRIIWKDIKEQPDDLSLTNEMMQVFKRGEEPCHRN